MNMRCGIYLIMLGLSSGQLAAEEHRPESVDLIEQGDERFRDTVQPFFQEFCIQCHGGEEPESELGLDQLSDMPSLVQLGYARFKKIRDKLVAGEMPPDGEPKPAAERVGQVVEWFDAVAEDLLCGTSPDPGRVTIRRLNRAEYRNTVRDLVGIDFELAEDFPSDDVGYGFDNIGDVLSLSPLLMEKYLDAAERTAQATIAMPDPESAPRNVFARESLKGPEGVELTKYGSYPLRSEGEVYVEFDFPRSGPYIVHAIAAAEQAGPDPARMALKLGDRPIEEFDVPGQRTPTRFQAPIVVAAGPQRIAAAFINDYYQPEAEDEEDRGDRNLYVLKLEIQGPLDLDPNSLSEPHKRVAPYQPGPDRTVAEAARDNLRPFVSRAFRRPVAEEELTPLVALVELADEHGEGFSHGMRVAMQAVLVSPHFLFRIEQDTDPDNPDAHRTLGDYELAARLSYFLWSSMPDERLFQLAERGELSRDEVFEAEVRRMLKHEKSLTLVENFAGQWLNLRNLELAAPDPEQFPDFDDRLRGDMRRETELLFETILREDRSVLELLDSGFTFVNERLAEHYGIDGVTGEGFQKVSLEGSQRAGVLTHASILTLTSNPERTSPVKRGKWIMENILGTPPPPPPPNVPELEETRQAAAGASLREQLELHRKDAGCASCHRQMDALGFGFENFDAIGRWRDADGSHPIDASGTLPGGETFQGPGELVTILRAKEASFSRCMTERMLVFALGRGLTDADQCTVDDTVDRLAQREYRFSEMVLGIVHSAPFRMRRGEGEKR